MPGVVEHLQFVAVKSVIAVAQHMHDEQHGSQHEYREILTPDGRNSVHVVHRRIHAGLMSRISNCSVCRPFHSLTSSANTARKRDGGRSPEYAPKAMPSSGSAGSGCRSFSLRCFAPTTFQDSTLNLPSNSGSGKPCPHGPA